MNELTAHESIDVKSLEDLSVEDLRALISRLEVASRNGAPVEIPIHHHFSKGVYGREMRAPRGAFIIGKIHKYQSLNILSAGEVSVLSIDGVLRVKAPYTFVASPGAQRVILVHEDAVWTTIHGTDETDVDKIEDQFIAKSYDDVPVIDLKEQVCLGS